MDTHRPIRKTGTIVIWLAIAVLHAAGAEEKLWWTALSADHQLTSVPMPTARFPAPSRKWTVTVGEGLASPALGDPERPGTDGTDRQLSFPARMAEAHSIALSTVRAEDRLYVFARQDGDEVLRCFDAATGRVWWTDRSPVSARPGSVCLAPRNSPAVADGKVVTLGTCGTLSCFDAETGRLLWRRDGPPGGEAGYSAINSPLITDGVCIVQLGSRHDGTITAYDLASGREIWEWFNDGSSLASPVMMTVDGVPAVMAATRRTLVAIDALDGTVYWQIPCCRGNGTAANPAVAGPVLIYSGPDGGIAAERLWREVDEFASETLWTNTDHSLQFHRPLLKDGLLYGVSANNRLFCVDTETGKTAWSVPLAANAGGGPDPASGFGAILEYGSVLLALTPGGQLIAFAPSGEGFQPLAICQISDNPTFACPVLSSHRLFVKEENSLTMWAWGE